MPALLMTLGPLMLRIIQNVLNLSLFALEWHYFRDYLLTYLLSDRLVDYIRKPNTPNRNRASPGDNSYIYLDSL